MAASRTDSARGYPAYPRRASPIAAANTGAPELYLCLAADEQQRRPYRASAASWSLLRFLLFRGAVKRLDTPRNGQRIGTCRSRSSFKLVGTASEIRPDT